MARPRLDNRHKRGWGTSVREEVVMSIQRPATRTAVVSFAPKKERPDATLVADDAGHNILTLLHNAADMAKEDCARAMDLAHKLSFQLRAAEEKVRDFGEQAAHFRDRAVRAEDWLARIHNEVEQTFFHKNEPHVRQPRDAGN